MRKLGVLTSILLFLLAFVRELPLGAFWDANATGQASLSLAILNVEGLRFFSWGTVDAAGRAQTPMLGPLVEQLVGLGVWLFVLGAALLALAGSAKSTPPHRQDTCFFLAGSLCVVEIFVFVLFPAFYFQGFTALFTGLAPGFYILVAAAVGAFVSARTTKDD